MPKSHKQHNTGNFPIPTKPQSPTQTKSHLPTPMALLFVSTLFSHSQSKWTIEFSCAFTTTTTTTTKRFESNAGEPELPTESELLQLFVHTAYGSIGLVPSANAIFSACAHATSTVAAFVPTSSSIFVVCFSICPITYKFGIKKILNFYSDYS